MAARFGPRFGAESAFIIAVAVVAALLELSWPAVAGAVFTAWVIVAAVEIIAAGTRRPAPSAELVEAPAQPFEPLLPPPPQAEVGRPGPFDQSFERELEPERTPAAEPSRAPEVVREPLVAAVTPPPPRPEPRVAPPPPVPLPEPAATPAARTTSLPDLRPPSTRQWNLWELEGRARERAGQDPLRDEEWSFLLMYLREFADANGMLPADFDPLVRESFAELIRSAG